MAEERIPTIAELLSASDPVNDAPRFTPLPPRKSTSVAGATLNAFFTLADLIERPISTVTEAGAQLVGARPFDPGEIASRLVPRFLSGKEIDLPGEALDFTLPETKTTGFGEVLINDLLGPAGIIDPESTGGKAARIAGDVLNPAAFLTLGPLVGAVGKVTGPAARAGLRGVDKVPLAREVPRQAQKLFGGVFGGVKVGAKDAGEALGLPPERANQLVERLQDLRTATEGAAKGGKADALEEMAKIMQKFPDADPEVVLRIVQRSGVGLDLTQAKSFSDPQMFETARDALRIQGQKSIIEKAQAGRKQIPSTVQPSQRGANLGFQPGDDTLRQTIGDPLSAVGEQELAALQPILDARNLDQLLRASRNVLGKDLTNEVLENVQLAQVNRIPIEGLTNRSNVGAAEAIVNRVIKPAKKTGAGDEIFDPATGLIINSTGQPIVDRSLELGRNVTNMSNVATRHLKKAGVESETRGLVFGVSEGALDASRGRQLRAAHLRGTAKEINERSNQELMLAGVYAATGHTVSDILKVNNASDFMRGALNSLDELGFTRTAQQLEEAGISHLYRAVTPDELKGVPGFLQNMLKDKNIPVALDDVFKNYVRAYSVGGDIHGPLGTLSRVFGAFRTGTTFWKATTLGLFPSFIARNQFGLLHTGMHDAGVLSGPTGLARLPGYVADHMKSQKALMFGTRDPEMLDFIKLSRSKGLSGVPGQLSGFASEFSDVTADLSIRLKLANGIREQAGVFRDQLTAKNLMAMSEREGFARAGERFFKTFGESLPAVGFWVNSVLEDGGKLAHFRHLLKRTGLPLNQIPDDVVNAAVRRARAISFQMDDLSRFERDFVTYGLPFYRFMRQAVPLSFDLIRREPEGLFVLKQTLEAIQSGFDNVDFSDLPISLQESLPLLLGTDDQGDQRIAQLESFLPIAEMNKLTKLLRDPANEAISQSTPLLKAPFEAASGLDTFRGGPRAFPSSPDVQFAGFRTDPDSHIRLLAQQFRFITEYFDRLNPGGVLGTEDEPGIFPKFLEKLGLTTAIPRTRRDVDPGERALQLGTGFKIFATSIRQEKRRRRFEAEAFKRTERQRRRNKRRRGQPTKGDRAETRAKLKRILAGERFR